MSDLINDTVSSARARSFSSRLSLESLGSRDLARPGLCLYILLASLLFCCIVPFETAGIAFLEPDLLLLDRPLLGVDPTLLALPPDLSLESLDLPFLLLSEVKSLRGLHYSYLSKNARVLH